jgi:RNA recognition motif-containing protein
MTMSKKLYVGNLSFNTTDDDLRVAFNQHGNVVTASVVTDRDTGRARGFGFVEMSDGGDEAIQALHGSELQGRTLTVNEARARPERSGHRGDGRRERH